MLHRILSNKGVRARWGKMYPRFRTALSSEKGLDVSGLGNGTSMVSHCVS